jgi:hypothetical protein
VSRSLEALRAVVISPEALAIVASIALAILWPEAIVWICEQFEPSDYGGRLALLGIPIALLVPTYSFSYGLLNPGDSRTELKKWPEYWRLKLRIWVALWYSSLSVVAFFVGWAAVEHRAPILGTTLMLSSLLTSSVCLLSVGIARLQLRDALDGV